MRLVQALALSIPVLCLSVAHASTFTPGAFATVDDGDWGYGYDDGFSPTVGYYSALLVNNYDNVYLPSSDLLYMGGTNRLIFTNGDSVWAYIGANDGEAPSVLTNPVLLDPAAHAGGFFGATTVGLELNVDFSAAGVLAHPDGVSFGDLIMTDLEDATEIDPSLSAFDGETVSDFLAYQNYVLGGGSTPYTLEDLDVLSSDLSDAFPGGEYVSSFADEHLELPATGTGGSPTSPVPEPPTWMLLLAAPAALPLFGRRTS